MLIYVRIVLLLFYVQDDIVPKTVENFVKVCAINHTRMIVLLIWLVCESMCH